MANHASTLGILRAHNIVVCLIVCIVTSHRSQLKNTKYRNVQCLWESCSRETVVGVNSITACALECGRSPECHGFIMSFNGSCSRLLESDCFSKDVCLKVKNMDVYQNVRLQEKNPGIVQCKHNGVWDPEIDACKCTDDWVGLQCERYPYHCGELYIYHYTGAQWVYIIDIYRDGSRIIYLRCYTSSTYSITYIFSNDFSDNSHHRTWNEYVNGYNLYNSEWNWSFWLGLRNMLDLQRMGHTQVGLEVAMEDERNGNRFMWRNLHMNFTLQDSAQGYSYTTDPRKLQTESEYFLQNVYELDDVLWISQGNNFSTFDNNNDNEENRNCANETWVGWWYNHCSEGLNTNPLGYEPGQSPHIRDIALPGLNFTDVEVRQFFKSVIMYYYFDSTEDPLA